MTKISDMTPLTLTSPTGVFAPVEKTGSTTNYRVDLAAMSSVTPQMFGAVADGVTDDSAAFVAAILYLRGFALNTGGSGFYKGSPELFIPAGHYYLGTTTLDINHTLVISGEGSGRFGPNASGCTRLRWAAGANGIRVQHPNTSGNTTVDVTTHDGAGGVFLEHLCLEGGYAGTEGDYHGLVCRGVTTGHDLYIKKWQGEGIKGLAGNQTGGGTVGGNFSVSCFMNCRFEENRIGTDVRGSDANVVTFLNCEIYQNRQAGVVDDNGAGSNTYIGCHAASNGLISGATPTQCSYSGNIYAAKWGGTFTVAPSGTTADTANWLYVEAGAADVTHPAWVNTADFFRAGGDYVTLNSAGVSLVNCYSEAPGFSQFNSLTLVENGTISQQYFRGGNRIVASTNGLEVFPYTGGALALRSRTGEVGVFAYDELGAAFGYLDFVKTGDAYVNGVNGVTFRHNGTLAGRITTTGLVVAGTVAGSNLSGSNTGDQTITLTGDVTGTGTGSFATTLLAATVVSKIASQAIAPTSVAIGGGTAITKSVVYTPSITPASVAADTVAEQTFTVTGLTTADKVIVNPPAIANATGIAGARVSAADTLAIRFVNPTAGALTPTSGTYAVLALRS